MPQCSRLKLSHRRRSVERRFLALSLGMWPPRLLFCSSLPSSLCSPQTDPLSRAILCRFSEITNWKRKWRERNPLVLVFFGGGWLLIYSERFLRLSCTCFIPSLFSFEHTGNISTYLDPSTKRFWASCQLNVFNVTLNSGPQPSLMAEDRAR